MNILGKAGPCCCRLSPSEEPKKITVGKQLQRLLVTTPVPLVYLFFNKWVHYKNAGFFTYIYLLQRQGPCVYHSPVS